MTVTTTANRIEYTGNGSTTAFSYPYAFIAAADLVVLVETTATGAFVTKSLGVDYTISGGSGSSGVVTMTTAPTSAQTLIIYRDPSLLQSTDYTANDPFPAESHERALDRLTMISQRDREIFGQAFRVPENETNTARVPAEAERKGKVAFFDSVTGDLTAVSFASLSGSGDPDVLTLKVSEQTGSTPYARLKAAFTTATGTGYAGYVIIGEAGTEADTGGETVTIPSNTTFIANGMKITSTTTITGDAIVATAENAENVAVIDLDLDCAATLSITGITKANPGVVTTSAAHGLANGDLVLIRDVKGMTEVNNTSFSVANVTSTTFELQTAAASPANVDTSSYTTYTSGGRVIAPKTTTAGFQAKGVRNLFMLRPHIYNWSTYGLDVVSSSTMGAKGVLIDGWQLDNPGPGCDFAGIVRSGTGGKLCTSVIVRNGVGWGTDPTDPSVADYTAQNHYTADFWTFQGVDGVSFINNTVRYSGSAGGTASRGCRGIVISDCHFEMCEEPGFNLGSGIMITHLADITGWVAQTDAEYASTPLPATSTATSGTARVAALNADSSGTGGWAWLDAVTGVTLGDETFEGDDWTQDGNATVVDVATSLETIGGADRDVIHSAEDAIVTDNKIVDCGITKLGTKTPTGITQANPCVVTVSGGHDRSDDDLVYFTAGGGMAQLEGYTFKVANSTATTFELQDPTGNAINSTGYTAWSSGGSFYQRRAIGAFQCTRLWGESWFHGNIVTNPRGNGAVSHIINNARGRIGYGVNWYEGRQGEEISSLWGDYRKSGADSVWTYQEPAKLAVHVRADIASTGTVTNAKGTGTVVVNKSATGTYQCRLTRQMPDKNFDVLTNFSSAGTAAIITKTTDHEFTITTRQIEESDSVAISGATQANPVVLTVPSGHGYQKGDVVYISGVGGMTEINDAGFVVNAHTGTTLSLAYSWDTTDTVDGSGFTAYASGGTVQKKAAIATSQVKLEDRAHSLAVIR